MSAFCDRTRNSILRVGVYTHRWVEFELIERVDKLNNARSVARRTHTRYSECGEFGKEAFRIAHTHRSEQVESN
ncbi:hypothetical protein NDU88_003987 [Pleurodeles waltl]|uniref:Uncharacterized protein n=1 Tax=Pleurodeles waltl TaxID=8319 RepID=A0AAV7RGT1_PLEWA|nr:hypothetical protein NDU88_003987 [Pleurodeles waltl]